MTSVLLALRKQLRLQRRQLNRFQQRQAEQRCLQHLLRLPEYQSAQHIGLYLHAFGEVATQALIWMCLKRGKTVYLPVICNMNQQLRWVKLSIGLYRGMRFSRHPLGMQQPMLPHSWPVSHLDLLVMPLLACDTRGLRLGMGGGYYDRTLAHAPHRPFRLGLAHEFQWLNEQLPARAWDQAIDALITPKRLRRF